MTLVHTVVLKPRLVLADALQRFVRRPLPLWLVGFVTLLPDMLRSHPLPNDLEGWQLYLSNAGSMQDLQTQFAHEVVTNTMGFAAGVVAWPILTLLTQGVPVADFLHVGLSRLWGAACATTLALLALLVLGAALLLPTLVVFIVGHATGESWFVLPGMDHMGFWLMLVSNGFITLLVVSLVGGALIVVPAEACAHPAPARVVVQRSWRMCRDYLGGAAWVLGWLVLLGLGMGLVNQLLESAGIIGRALSYASQGALATIPALAGASLHAALSQNQGSTHQDSAAAGGGVGSGMG